MLSLYNSIFSLMGGHLKGGLTQQEAMDIYMTTGELPLGWRPGADGSLVRDVEFSDVLANLEEGPNKTGDGPLAFMTEGEIAKFRALGRYPRQFATAYRAPLPENLSFRDFYKEADVDDFEQRENAEPDLDHLRQFLIRHPSPAKVVFPFEIATDALVKELLAGQRIPEVDLHKSSDVTDACLVNLKGVRRLWIDSTQLGGDLIRVADTVEELEAIDSNLGSDQFPALSRLKRLSCGATRVGATRILTFEPLRRLKELRVEAFTDVVTCFGTLPLSLETLSVHGGNALVADHLARLPSLRALYLNQCGRVLTFPESVQTISLKECTAPAQNATLDDTFKERRFESVTFNRMGFVPMPAFTRRLSFKMMDLGAAETLPPCEVLIINRCGEVRTAALPATLLELEMRGTELAYEGGALAGLNMWERLRRACPNLKMLRLDRTATRNPFGRPLALGFDLEFI